jgi:hypothetical protein
MAKNSKNNEETTELATVAPAGALVASAADDLGFGDFSDDADKRSRDELVLERFRITQAMTKNKKQDGLVDGDLYGNMTRKGLKSAVIVPIHDWRTIVERTSDDSGAFVAEYLEKSPDDFGDATINGYVKAVTAKEVHKVETGNGNKLGLVYNCLVAFLDEETGTEVKGLGVLQADKTNIRPYLLWRQNRVDFNGATKVPTYAFRTRVDGQGEYTNPDGKTTQQYRFNPFKDGNWKSSLLSPKDNLELLQALKAQKEMLVKGELKIASVGDADVGGNSEAADEAAAF